MFCAIFIKLSCWRGGMADASDSKSDVGDNMWVQVPPPAPKRRFDTCCVKPFFVELSPKRTFTFCKVQYIFTHKWKCCRNDTFFTYSVTLRWSVEIATTSISKIRPLFTADFFGGNCISDIKVTITKLLSEIDTGCKLKGTLLFKGFLLNLQAIQCNWEKRITNAW